jgi:hypothetical protein
VSLSAERIAIANRAIEQTFAQASVVWQAIPHWDTGDPGALSSCWLMRVSGAVLDQDGVAVALWSGGCGGQSGDLVPGGESGGHLMAILGRCESVASRSEMR